MTDSAKRHAPILAAGGIVLRGKTRPRIAVVRMRREKAWVLPKGKLQPREPAHIGARREVLEETGYDAAVHEFLGSMSYAVEGRIKIVQFWLMAANGAPVRRLMGDVKAVKWLPLKKAIETLTRPHEKVFLTHVGPSALNHAKKFGRRKPAAARKRKISPTPAVGHVIALNFEKTRPNAIVKALGNWMGHAAQARRAG